MGDLSALKLTEQGQEVVRPFSAYNLKKNDTVKSTDTTPFLYRPIPPLSTPYIREKLVGASMVWNQLVYDSYTKNYATSIEKTSSGWVVTSDGTHNTFGAVVKEDSSNHLIFNRSHKYFLSVNIKAINVSNFSRLYFNRSSNRYVITQTGRYQTFFYTDSDGSIVLTAETTNASTTSSDSFTFDEFYIIDLTLAFSPAIADRIYSMEQAQAGSGIAWLRSYGFLTDDYYANDAGSLQSVCADRKEIVGKNLFDVNANDWIKSQNTVIYSVSGESITITAPGSSAYSIKKKIFYITQDMVGKSVTLSGTISGSTPQVNSFRLRIYDDPDLSGSFTDFTVNAGAGTGEITSAMVGKYMSIIMYAPITIGQSTTYSNVQIEIGSLATVYEPYHKTTISLGHDELRGVMQLDANNNLVYYGDEKSADGTIDRKFAIVDLGTLNYDIYSADNRIFYSDALSANGNDFTSDATYTRVFTNKPAELNNKEMLLMTSNHRVYIRDTAYTTAAAIKTALSGVYLIYPLATPTTEQSTPFTSPQYLFDGGTEEFIDYGVEQETRDVAVPVGHVTEYMGASDGTEIKDKFYLPTLPDDDGEYKLTAKIQNGVLAEAKWDNENLIDDTTKVEYKLGINNGLLYIEEV